MRDLVRESSGNLLEGFEDPSDLLARPTGKHLTVKSKLERFEVMSREAVGEAGNDGTHDRPSGGRSSPTPRSVHPGFLIRMHPMRIWGLGRAQHSFRLLDFTPSQRASYSIPGVLVKMVERHRQQLHVQIGLLFTTCDYCVLTF